MNEIDKQVGSFTQDLRPLTDKRQLAASVSSPASVTLLEQCEIWHVHQEADIILKIQLDLSL